MAIDLMSAGGAVLDTTTAGAGDIKSGKTAYNGDGELVTGTYALPSTTAGAGDILEDKTAVDSSGTLLTGTMTNRGAWNSSVNPGGSVTIPAGYHNGSGKVTGNRSYTTVYLGQHSGYWSSFTYNVKSHYPSIYSRLSRSNFYAVPYAWKGNGVEWSGSGTSGDFISYNASNGVVTMGSVMFGTSGQCAIGVLWKLYMVY